MIRTHDSSVQGMQGYTHLGPRISTEIGGVTVADTKVVAGQFMFTSSSCYQLCNPTYFSFV